MRVVDYQNMAADAPRIEAFRRAIETTVRPGSRVLDLGTGLGTYAMFAARAGARVYAVEGHPVIGLARQLAADNSLAGRIEFRAGWLEQLEPGEPADVLVFEDYAPYLYEPRTVRILDDARRRWLRPNAVTIPAALHVMLAPVSSEETYGFLRPWPDGHAYGLDLGRLADAVVNAPHPTSWTPDALLAEPVEVGRADPLDSSTFELAGCAEWKAERAGALHGLGLWLDMDLAEGVRLSNRPSGRWTGWAQVFLPLAEPVEVEAGGTLQARVAAVGSADGGPGWLTWRVTACGATQTMNTFAGLPLSMERLRRASPDHRPTLGRLGRVRRTALELMDGRRSVAEIARELHRRHPEELPAGADALRVVAAALEITE